MVLPSGVTAKATGPGPISIRGRAVRVAVRIGTTEPVETCGSATQAMTGDVAPAARVRAAGEWIALSTAGTPTITAVTAAAAASGAAQPGQRRPGQPRPGRREPGSGSSCSIAVHSAVSAGSGSPSAGTSARNRPSSSISFTGHLLVRPRQRGRFPQRLAQPAPGPAEPGPHGPDRHAQGNRGLLVTQVPPGHQQQRVPVPGRQPGERGGQPPVLPAGAYPVVGTVGEALRDRIQARARSAPGTA